VDHEYFGLCFGVLADWTPAAKTLMMLQSLLSLLIIALRAACAVNIL
jgi:hypothetical protein